jgi:aspartate/methionine/tyrosine aminotransferase
MEPLSCEGGYFLLADISKCRDLIPAKYFESHDYLPEGQQHSDIEVNRVTMPDGSIPLDLAFCRWLACEKGLAVMPNSFFYDSESVNMSQNFVRLAICMTYESVCAAAQKLFLNQ